ncbi:claudin-23 [Apteryx mantelli]|uniref:Claudin-23 n=1 Tax=Apteryx mantelli TaxID=2696672 RepID=A0ABM4EL30_9AVES
MRTPAAMIVGLVLCPCGLLLTLTGTLAPTWRQVSRMADQPADLVLEQGIWEACSERQSSHARRCRQADELGYFEQAPVRAARGLMPAALALAALGLAAAALGVRCWRREPRHPLAGAAGLALLLSGLLSLAPVSWYTHALWALPAPAGGTLAAGYGLVLSYLGSCLEILGGLALALSFHRCLQERRDRKPPASPTPAAGSRTAAAAAGAYRNPADVLQDERDWRSALPCDSDL